MTTNPISDLSADRPLHSIKEDLLGRGQFALAIANAVSAWRGDESLVMALYGAWGSGKSTIKNFVLEFLSSAEAQVTVVEFNPWAWSGQGHLMAAFFQEIGLALGESAQGEKGNEVAARWKKYASRLTLGGTILKFVKSATGVIGVPVVPILADMVSEMANEGSELLKQAAEATSDDDDEPLEKLKKSLAASLAKLGQPVLVVMDDVDRLSSDEIRLLFQLIKINADFPNVIFLLLFDREVIEASLASFSGSSGRAYMEKIVQVGFDIPEASRSDLDTAFITGLENTLSRYPRWKDRFDLDRWPIMYQKGLRPFLNTMRDVRRFLSSFSFTIGLFRNNGTFEASITDVVAVEMLRLFEPAVYAQMRESQDALAINAQAHWMQDRDQTARKEKLAALIDKAPVGRRLAVREIIGELFPTAFRNFGPGFDEIWLRQLRICSPQMFQRYFLFGVPKGDVPQSSIEKIAELSANLEGIRTLLRGLQDDGSLPGILQRLQAYTDVLNLATAENFITALWDVGDEFPCHGDTFSGFGGPTMHAYRIVYHWLKREPDVKKRGKVVLGAMHATTGLHLPVDALAVEGQGAAKEGSASDAMLDPDDLNTAKQICVKKIEAAAREGRLLGCHLGSYLWSWKGWRGDEAPRKFVAELTTSIRGALQFVQGFVGAVTTTNTSTGAQRVRWEVRLSTLEQFVDIDQLKAVLAPLLTDSVATDHIALKAEFDNEITALKRAIERRAEGKNENDRWRDDEDYF